MQGSSYQPIPYPSQSHQQQPLFIIIPSTSGKHKSHVVPAYPAGGYGQHRRMTLVRGRSPRRNKLLSRLMANQLTKHGNGISPWFAETIGRDSRRVMQSSKQADISIVLPAVTYDGEAEEPKQDVIVVHPTRKERSQPHERHRSR